jgi:hypothetical protein
MRLIETWFVILIKKRNLLKSYPSYLLSNTAYSILVRPATFQKTSSIATNTTFDPYKAIPQQKVPSLELMDTRYA